MLKIQLSYLPIIANPIKSFPINSNICCQLGAIRVMYNVTYIYIFTPYHIQAERTECHMVRSSQLCLPSSIFNTFVIQTHRMRRTFGYYPEGARRYPESIYNLNISKILNFNIRSNLFYCQFNFMYMYMNYLTCGQKVDSPQFAT